MLIARDGHRVPQFDPTEDLLCPQCGLACPGVFDPAPGIWDGRGQVVSRLGDAESLAALLGSVRRRLL